MRIKVKATDEDKEEGKVWGDQRNGSKREW